MNSRQVITLAAAAVCAAVGLAAAGYEQHRPGRCSGRWKHR